MKCDCCGKAFSSDYLWRCVRCLENICASCLAIGSGPPDTYGLYEHGEGQCVRCWNEEYCFDYATGETRIDPCLHDKIA